MKKVPPFILAVLAVSSILRLINLGSIPQGVSIEEIKFGLSLASISDYLPKPLAIRLPFALLGILSIYLFYKLTLKIFNDEKIALISAFILGITPWHIQESRIFSWGIVIFTLLVSINLLFWNKLQNIVDRNLKYLIVIFVIFLASTAVFNSYKQTSLVNGDRQFAYHVAPKTIVNIFENKIIESYRQTEKYLFDNLDFGNLLFAGHPRENWGVEQKQELLILGLPFLAYGLFKIDQQRIKFLIFYFIASSTVLTIFSATYSSEALILLLPFPMLTAFGISEMIKKKTFFSNIVFYSLVIFAVYEFANFSSLYFQNYSESIFSPRKPIYADITSSVTQLKKPNEKVLVNNAIGDPYWFFAFYLNKNLNDYEFRSFNFKNEKDKDKLFVDVIPDEPNPSEPLYNKDGFPSTLDIQKVLADTQRRQKIVIYRIYLPDSGTR